MYQHIVIIGRAGGDAEHKVTGNDTRIAKFSVAVNQRRGGKQHTEWFRCVCFAKLADIASDYVTKGKLLSVQGRMQRNTWTDGDGQKHERWELIADNLTLLGQRQERDDNQVQR